MAQGNLEKLEGCLHTAVNSPTAAHAQAATAELNGPAPQDAHDGALFFDHCAIKNEVQITYQAGFLRYVTGYTPREDLPMTYLYRATLAALTWCSLSIYPLTAQMMPSVWPRCIAERDGQQLGLAGSVCECSYEQGSIMSGKPPGWRWNCDILRSDGSSLEMPADPSNGRQSLPPGFTYAPQSGTSMQPGLQNQPSGQSFEVQPRRPAPLFEGRRRQ